MAEPKYKVGDWLEIFQLSQGDSGIIGHKFQVKTVPSDSEGRYTSTFETHAKGGCWLECDVRPIQQPYAESSNYPIF